MTTLNEKRADLLVRATDPFNGGPTLEQLNAGSITPNDAFFVRNHGDIPEINPSDFRLTVNGMLYQPLALTLDDIKSLPAHTVTATLQCAGNRRVELATIAPIPNELEWDQEAISTAVWRGARLRDVLAQAGIDAGAGHVAMLGIDEIAKDGETFGFGGSIPLAKALHPDTLLAYEMNDAPLPPTHGYPLRALIPGYIGARSVKWLSQITAQAQPSDNYYQSVAYRLLPPDAQDEDAAVMLGELPLISVILSPAPNAVLASGDMQVQGYAYASERAVVRVDVSCDGGQTWRVARLLGEAERWAWRKWETTVQLAPGQHMLVVRAWDSAAQTQPEQIATVWNIKGYMNNAWHRVPIVVR
ncbi:MAG: sulfite oxidase [Chloroflexota bacterium]|nr:sulfite oxidase [Chloroflexota bacterium]